MTHSVIRFTSEFLTGSTENSEVDLQVVGVTAELTSQHPALEFLDIAFCMTLSLVFGVHFEYGSRAPSVPLLHKRSAQLRRQ